MKKYQVAIIGTIGAKHYEYFQKVKDRFNVHTLCGLTEMLLIIFYQKILKQKYHLNLMMY